MKSTTSSIFGKKLSLIVLTGVLISTTGFLSQSAYAGSTTSTPMPSNMPGMVMPAPTPKVTPKATPKATQKPATSTKVTSVSKKSPVKATPTKVTYTLKLGTPYSKAKATVYFTVKSGKKSVKTTIGSFTASTSGVLNFTYKATIAKTAMVSIVVKGKVVRTLTGAALHLLTVPTQALPFVEPTPTPTLIPDPVPTDTPTPTPTPTTPAAPSVAPTPTFGTFYPTHDGYVVQIANFDSKYIWTAIDNQKGIVSVSPVGQVTVTKLAAGTVSTLTVVASKPGYTQATATSASVTVLAADAAVVTPPSVPSTPTPPPSNGGGGGVVYVYAPNIALSISNVVLNQLDTFPAYVVNNTGGLATSYAISPSAPAGTTFDTTTGILSGTLTAGQSLTTYTITATNTSGHSTAQFALTVNSGALQTISFLTPYDMRFGDTDQVLNGASDSGLAVTYTVLPNSRAVCSIVPVLTDFDVHALGAGTCIIEASQAGNGTYLPALKVQKSFIILPSASSSFLVQIQPNGGSFSNGSFAPISEVVAAGTVLTLPSVTNTLFTSYTWTLGDVSGTVVSGSTITVTSDLVLVAKWA